MIGCIRKPNAPSGGGGGFNPDDYFDPTTHIATEANFIKLLEDGIYDSSLIGYKVQLSNSSGYYNNGLWVIADVDHDSENTGQTNCYDLISMNCVTTNTIQYGSDVSWRSSNIRYWLKNTFYAGFSSNFKMRMLQLKYNSGGSWYNDDYLVSPSYEELNGTSYQYNEGVAYPIFTDDTSRAKKDNWWTRTVYSNTNVWFVNTQGSLNSRYYTNYECPVAILRVQ